MATENQKNCLSEVSYSLILRDSNEPFLDRIVMCEENGSYTTTGDSQISD